jgi:hypothetical protein
MDILKNTIKINNKQAKCSDKECNKQPSFGYPGQKAIYCKDHKIINMVDLHHTLCKGGNCNIRANYDYLNGKGQYCNKHKLEGMINIYNKICTYENCKRIAIYGIDKKMFCNAHKTDEMKNLKTSYCKENGCNITKPSFGYPGKSGEYCFTHKKEGMVSVTTKKCKFIGCNLQPSYGFLDKIKEYCNKHKFEGMINLSSKNCEFDKCVKKPLFDIPGGNGRFCKSHKLEGMIDVQHNTCIYENCIHRPNYNYPGKKGQYCNKHKLEGMIDLINKTCNIDGCNIRSYYGFPGKTPSKCHTHRENGMIKRPNSKCLKCKNNAIYGINLKALHCEIHKSDNEINLCEAKCKSCNLIMILNKDEKCEFCDPIHFEKIRLSKQKDLMDYLDSVGLYGNSTDKPINNGLCGKERPDRTYEMIDKIIVLECDEYQHKDRNCVCEQTRMINITQSYGGIPVYFIRWNPDNYKSNNKNENIKKRYILLEGVLRNILDNKLELPKALCSALYLYYDGWKCISSEEWEIIQKYDI